MASFAAALGHGSEFSPTIWPSPAGVAQSAEHRHGKAGVVGLIPTSSSTAMSRDILTTFPGDIVPPAAILPSTGERHFACLVRGCTCLEVPDSAPRGGAEGIAAVRYDFRTPPAENRPGILRTADCAGTGLALHASIRSHASRSARWNQRSRCTPVSVVEDAHHVDGHHHAVPRRGYHAERD